MNWDDFEALIRSSCDDELENDDDSAATWPETDLIAYANLALSNYSRHFPLESIKEVTVVAGTQAYDLPDDIVTPPHKSIVDASWRRSATLVDHLVFTRWRPGSNEQVSTSGTGKGARIWGSQFLLEDVPTSSDAAYPIVLYYYAIHTAVPADPSAFSFTVPDSDIECIFWYTTALMMMKLDSGDSTLRQYADDEDLGGRRDDSPPAKSAERRMKEYRQCVSERLTGRETPRLKRVRR